MKGSRDQGFVLDFAGLGIGDSDVVDLEGAAEGAFVIGLGLFQVGKGTEFRPLSSYEVALREDDVIDGGGAETILLLFGVKSLLLQFASFTGGGDLGAVLRERDVAVAHIEESRVFQLLQLGFELALGEQGTGAVGLSRAVAQREV